MKKIFLLAFVALSTTVMAQTVNPITIELAEYNLDSLRTLYLSQPNMYRAVINDVALKLDKNAQDLKAAKTELKVEQAHAKEMEASLQEASKMMTSMSKLYEKEESELKKMQKTVEKQQRTLAKQKELNAETREEYMQFLEKQQKELGYSLREVADRQRAIADLESAIQNGQTRLAGYHQQLILKAADLSKIESELKNRTTAIKAEQKTAKGLK